MPRISLYISLTQILNETSTKGNLQIAEGNHNISYLFINGNNDWLTNVLRFILHILLLQNRILVMAEQKGFYWSTKKSVGTMKYCNLCRGASSSQVAHYRSAQKNTFLLVFVVANKYKSKAKIPFFHNSTVRQLAPSVIIDWRELYP